MDSSIRSTLWRAFAVLVVLIAAGLALTMGILGLSKRQEYRIVEGSGSLLIVILSVIVIGVAAYLIRRIEQSLIAVQGVQPFAVVRAANDNRLGAEPSPVEGVQWLADFQHHIVGHVDDVADWPHPCKIQTTLEPPR